MKALLIVDIQNDFLPNGALAVPEGDQIIPVVNSIIEKFPLVVATQDWHPANHGSFASTHPGKQPFDMGELSGMPQVLWPDHCVQGSEGAAFSNKLNTNALEAIIRKGTDAAIDSYSGFFDNGKLKSTGLADYMKGRGVDEVYIVGLAADYCVGFTALDAIEAGFKVFVVEDATRPIDPQGWMKMQADIKSKGGNILKSVEL
jgi:nicotinamidase/pyrazinamidase